MWSQKTEQVLPSTYEYAPGLNIPASSEHSPYSMISNSYVPLGLLVGQNRQIMQINQKLWFLFFFF